MKSSLQDNPETTRRGGHWLAKLLVPKLILAVIVVALLAAGWLSMKNYYENQNKTTKLGFEDIGEFATQECRSPRSVPPPRPGRCSGCRFPSPRAGTFTATTW